MAQGRKRVSVLVADDHPIYREAIARAVKDRPELELVGEAADGREALARIEELRPDVALLDIEMPELNGPGVLEALAGQDGDLPGVIFVSAFARPQLAGDALAAGAKGYLSKVAGAGEICEAIVAVARGGTAFAVARGDGAASERGPALTARERQVLGAIASGRSAPQIGAELGLSPATVKDHLRTLYGKLGVSGRAAAVAEAMRRGLIE